MLTHSGINLDLVNSVSLVLQGLTTSSNKTLHCGHIALHHSSYGALCALGQPRLASGFNHTAKQALATMPTL
jgi:hypothetical protein